MDDEIIRERLTEEADRLMAAKAARYGTETMRSVEKQVLLQTIDQNWRDHLITLDHLRSVVGFRGYAQRDPLNEYKSEAFSLFDGLLTKLRSEVTRMLAHVQVMTAEEQQAMAAALQARAAEEQAKLSASHPEAAPERTPEMAGAGATAPAAAARSATVVSGPVDPDDPASWGSSGRNDPCPCGSGRKYKHCHGKV